MPENRVYILGAGSSIGHSNGLFPSIFDFFKATKKLRIDLSTDFVNLLEYATKLYDKEVFTANIEDLHTNVEIDLLKSYTHYLLLVKKQLIDLIKKVLINLENELKDDDGEYHQFRDEINNDDLIITFNWDIVLDNVLQRQTILSKNSEEITKFHYKNFFDENSAYGESTIGRLSIGKPYINLNNDKAYLLKMHGSVDWLYCSNEGCRACNKVWALPNPLEIYSCSECHEPLETLIIPPALNKEYNKYPLIRKIWNLAAKRLAYSEELIIWGYSLPITDFYCHWLLRKARTLSLRRLVLINPDVLTKFDKRRKRSISKSFMEKYSNIFKGLLSGKDIELYEYFSDYVQKRNVFEKYNIERPRIF